MQNFELFIRTQSGLLLAFALTAALIVWAGIRLSVYGDALGDRTGIGNGLIGLIFLAAVTSLPELVVSLTSVLKNSNLNQGADLAIGNMLGSNVFNLLILALVTLFFPKKFNSQTLDNPHTSTTIYGVILLTIFSISFAFANKSLPLVPFLQCSIPILFIPILYGILIQKEHQHTSLETQPNEAEEILTHQPAAIFYSKLSFFCGLIIFGGIGLSILGSRMALPPEQGGFGLEASLIGTLFLAISTSLPELVISFSSVRLGFLDMAIGNVLGSNMFNLLIVFVTDIAMRNTNLLTHASSKHWNSVGLIFGLTLLTSCLLRSRNNKQMRLIATAMIAIYLATFVFLK